LEKKLKSTDSTLNMVNAEEITINIGKNGLSDNILNETNVVLKKYKKIRIKFLQSASERNNFDKAISLIISKTQAKLLKKIGFTIIISKK